MQTRSAFIVKKLESKVKHAIYDYSLIEQGDGVLAGISGGKDSFALLDILVNLNRTLPEKFRIVACHVEADDMPYKADKDFMVQYCADNNVELHFRSIVVEYDPSKRQPACFICSWKRRKLLFSLARELNCSKIALGHHLDDAVETLLLNMIHHSSVSSLPPKLSMFGGEIYLIRPLITVTSKELEKYTQVLGFPSEISLCPHHDETHRESVRGLIHQMASLNKAARENVFRSMGNIFTDYIVPSTKKNLPKIDSREV